MGRTTEPTPPQRTWTALCCEDMLQRTICALRTALYSTVYITNRSKGSFLCVNEIKARKERRWQQSPCRHSVLPLLTRSGRASVTARSTSTGTAISTPFVLTTRNCKDSTLGVGFSSSSSLSSASEHLARQTPKPATSHRPLPCRATSRFEPCD